MTGSAPTPFAAYAVVVTDDDLEIPLEAHGLAVFGRNHVDGDHGTDRLIAHELAHQWFGNSVTVTRWQDIWLHEGFACYAEWLWSEDRGDDTADVLAERYRQGLLEQPEDLVVGDPGAKDMFDDRVYKRGALALHARPPHVRRRRLLHRAAEHHRAAPARIRHRAGRAQRLRGRRRPLRRGRPRGDRALGRRGVRAGAARWLAGFAASTIPPARRRPGRS
ncbi:M1 family aminopeptidase [Curtobacterium flaccumfaciens]|nr:M1 family aminopeptidase [Curtobacterium flaccumfaciens]